MKNQFVSTLPETTQKAIERDLQSSLNELDLSQEEIAESLENAMNSRLCDLEETINITKYILS